MNLDVLPARSGSAAENMAIDFLLLQRYPRAGVPRFRHYGWRSAAVTFGYSQKIAFVRSMLPAAETFDLCRRPTGGGIVDHREDWTFSLVIPRGHPLEDARATQSYREIHECLAGALQRQGVPAVTKQPEMERVAADALGKPAGSSVAVRTSTGNAGVCFQQAELFDVIHEGTRAKIAGAAQKRNKHGLLFQGSLWRPAVGGALDEDQLETDFIAQLAAALDVGAQPTSWPELNEDEVAALTEHYASPEWVEWR